MGGRAAVGGSAADRREKFRVSRSTLGRGRGGAARPGRSAGSAGLGPGRLIAMVSAGFAGPKPRGRGKVVVWKCEGRKPPPLLRAGACGWSLQGVGAFEPTPRLPAKPGDNKALSRLFGGGGGSVGAGELCPVHHAPLARASALLRSPLWAHQRQAAALTRRQEVVGARS